MNKKPRKFQKTGKVVSAEKKDLKRDREEVTPTKVCMNDPSWYFVDQNLRSAVASLAFPQWIGRGFQVPQATTWLREGTIIAMPYYISLGQSSDVDSPFNLAVRNLYTFVRHANSGHSNYEAADLGLYLLATGNAIASCAHLERILGVAKYYQTRNSTVPWKLLEALGVVDPQNVINNLANWTARLNVMWVRLSSLCLPSDFNFIKRWLWMNSQVFKDHESPKAALYVFVPCVSGEYKPATATTGGMYKVGSGNIYNDHNDAIANLFSDVEHQIDVILADEDMNIMSGDILKAYGADKIIKFGTTPLDYQVVPQYVEEMLPQIQNLRTVTAHHTSSGISLPALHSCVSYEAAIALGTTAAAALATAIGSDLCFYQVPDQGLVECSTFSFAASATTDSSGATYWYDSTTYDPRIHLTFDQILNSYKEVPSPDDVIVSTRLMFQEGIDTRVNANAWRFTCSGTEIVAALYVIVADPSGSYYNYTSANVFSGGLSATLQCIDRISAQSQFDYHPIIYALAFTGGVSYVDRMFGDIDNFTIMSTPTLEMLHMNAVLGEFSVTQMNFIK